MSELSVEFENTVCSNAQVYGMVESIKASKYPFLTDVADATETITNTVKTLALSQCGSGEDTFMNGIIVQMDVTMSLKAWVELQRYHFMEFVSSQSTMHCLPKFNLESQCNEYVAEEAKEIINDLIGEYLEDKKKVDFLEMMYNIPSGFRYTARMSTNYRQLKTIYKQRRNHRLKPDWGEFCDWIEHLPLSWMITGVE